jgi:hypothetical protein
LELVRYIHLNSLRAGIVKGLKELEGYPYCGHRRVMGKIKDAWQDTDEVLSLFAERKVSVRKNIASSLQKDCVETHLGTPHKTIPKIDAEIAEKSHLWMETNLR